MKILVTGGLGVVGSKLVEVLSERSYDVWFCDNRHSHKSKYFRCDISEYRQLESIFERHSFDLVYNLAAEFGRWNGEDFYENVWKTNAIGLKNIIRLQKKVGFKLVHFSSSEVYGDYNGVMKESVMDEYPIKQMNDYAISKWVNELQINNSLLMDEAQTVIVRLFNTYGPGEYYSPYRSVISLFTYRALNDLPYTVYQNHHRTNTYIDDCVNAVSNIADNFISGRVYNIASDDYYDIKTLSDLVLRYSQKSDSKVIYKDVEPQTTINKKVDNRLSVKELGFKSTINIQEGIKRYVNWVKDEYAFKKI